MSLTPAKAVAFLVFMGALAGATYAVQSIVGDPLAEYRVGANPLHPELAAQPGQTVTYPISIENRGSAAEEVVLRVDGGGFAGEVDERVPENLALTVFLPVTVPADAAPGVYPLTVQILDDAGETLRVREGLLSLRVLGPGEGFQPGDAANITYTARISDTGRVFYSNDPALAGQRFDAVEGYRPGSGETRILTSPPTHVEGLLEGMVGMQVGETRSLVVPPEKAYGASTLETREPREETVARERTFPIVELRPIQRARFDEHIVNTSQGDPADFRAGDRFHVDDPQTGNRLPYMLTSIDDQQVRYRFAPQVGERFTVHAAWPNASEVTASDNTSVTFYTTPETPVDTDFTFHEHWPQMTRIVSMDDENIVLRHSPPVGTSHEEQDPATGEALRLTVKELTDEEIVYVYPSDNELAGKTLIFDVTVVKLEKAA